LTRHRRRWIAVSAAVLLAFAHAAIAVSGCLQGAMPAPEPGCEKHGQAAPNELVCRTHLQAETQTLDLAKVPQLPSQNTPALVLTRDLAVVPIHKLGRFPASVALGGAPPPLNVLYSRSLT
jgi:hypothetical protein